VKRDGQRQFAEIRLLRLLDDYRQFDSVAGSYVVLKGVLNLFFE
jgi:hypothetical protein